MIDKECLKCKRYYSGSCHGVEDRNRLEITIENSCSGFLHIEVENIIDRLFSVITELDARQSSNNCVSIDYLFMDWSDLCKEAIDLLEQIK